MDIENDEQLDKQKIGSEQEAANKIIPVSPKKAERNANKNAAPGSIKSHLGSGVKTVVARDKATGKKVWFIK